MEISNEKIEAAFESVFTSYSIMNHCDRIYELSGKKSDKQMASQYLSEWMAKKMVIFLLGLDDEYTDWEWKKIQSIRQEPNELVLEGACDEN